MLVPGTPLQQAHLRITTYIVLDYLRGPWRVDFWPTFCASFRPADKLLLAVDCLVFYAFLRNAFSDILLVYFPVSNAFDVYIVCHGNTAQFQHSSPLPRRYPCYRTAVALLSYRVSDVRTLH